MEYKLVGASQNGASCEHANETNINIWRWHRTGTKKIIFTSMCISITVYYIATHWVFHNSHVSAQHINKHTFVDRINSNTNQF